MVKLSDCVVTVIFIALAMSVSVIIMQYGMYRQPPTEVSHQAYIVGIVYEERWVRYGEGSYVLGRVPLQGVKVTLGSSVRYTDDCGYFGFAVEEYTYELTFEKDGYYTEYRVAQVYTLESMTVEMKQK